MIYQNAKLVFCKLVLNIPFFSSFFKFQLEFLATISLKEMKLKRQGYINISDAQRFAGGDF